MKNLVKTTAGIVFLALSTHSIAWGPTGHRVIGKIAESHLTETTRSAIVPLLAGDKLAEVTTWADEMRSNPEEFWQKKSGPWHYISIETADQLNNLNYSIPYKGEVKDIYTAILKSVTILSDDSASLADKEFYFRFLTHLVGDLHQPLHVGKAADKGGNTIRVKFFGEDVNLHWLWDSKLIESQRLSFTEFANFIDTKDQQIVQQYMSSNILDWIKESFHERKAVYAIGDGNFRFNYQYQHMPTVKKRLLQAGIRLAGLLNQIFDPNAKAGIDSLAKQN